jgi:hypothetical protein
MKATFSFLRSVLIVVLLYLSVPFVVGLWYSQCGERRNEQQWLNQVICHLKVLRTRTSDPDLQGVLDYTIHRYNHVGPWDVMFFPLANEKPGWRTLGINCPFIPGVTLDPEVMDYPIPEGSLILVHEALHDYWPYFGHTQVTPRIEKLEALQRFYIPIPYHRGD